MRAPAIIASAIFTSLFILSSSETLAASPNDDSSRIEESGWRTLTKRNFSSEIRRHPRLLLIVTVPWSGESRSLMKEVSHMVTDRQDEHGYLKLRVVYRNSEKMLADILGATEEITIFYYHQSTSYKYQGHLRARNILSSIYQFSTLRFEETFLETLQTQDDIESFSQSTDNAVLLLEFCGWSVELLHEQDFTDKLSDNAGILGDDVTREANGTLAFDKKNQKEWEDEELTCRAENGFTVDSWHTDFTSANQSASQAVDSWHTDFTSANQSASQAAESRHTGNEGSCTFEAFQQFQSFFSNFKTIAREHILPPERQRFGLISDRSLVPLLGVESPKAWLLMLHLPECLNCSIVLQEGDDLRAFIRAHNPFVTELDVDGHNLDPVFPSDRPSVILFVDRSSDSSEVREESKSSLQALRSFAQHNQLSIQMDRGADRMDSERSPAEASFRTWGRSIADQSGHRSRKHFAAPKLVKPKDKMSVMIVQQGESISLENLATVAQNNPAYDILSYLLHRENPSFKPKEKKISVLAKEVGFQLLSDDFDVQVVDPLAPEKVTDNMVTGALLSSEGSTLEFIQKSTEHGISINNGELASTMKITAGNEGKQAELPDMETGPQQNQETVPYSDSTHSKSDSKLLEELSDERGVAKSDGRDNSCMQENFGSYTELPDVETGLQQNQETVSYSDNNNSKSDSKLLEELNDERGVAKSDGSDNSFMQENTCHAEYSFHLEEESPISEENTEQEHSGEIDCALNKKCSREVSQNLPSALSDMVFVGDYAEKVQIPTATRQLSGQDSNRRPFLGLFFYYEGGYQLLRTLSGGSKIPSVVILDPVLQQHYVFPMEADINYSSLSSFVYEYLNGSLTPYRKSASPSWIQRETPRPPFVNLDFHETDSVPRVTLYTFCELIVGYKPCEMGNVVSSQDNENFESAWKMDALVVFSTPWCGFCQRMELTVREVYRAFKNFTYLFKSRSRTVDSMNIQGKMDDTAMNKLPSIYMMDCTENDCGPLLKSIGKKEQYPALVLFPAENKSAISYEGDVSVVSIIEFLASQGSNSQYLNRHKGFLWNHNLKGRKKRTTLTDASSFSVDGQRQYSKDKYTEIHVDDNHVHVGSHTPGTIPDQLSLPIDEQTPSTDGIYAQFVMGLVGKDTHHSHGSHTSRYSHDNVVPGTVLAATDKLQNSYPFNNSTIVIVRADQNHGFQGVIINKHLSWDVFKGSEELDLLRKAPLFFGGPVRAEGAPLVSLTRKPIEGFTEVETGIYFGDPSTTNIAIELIISGNCSAEDYSFFLGYSSWGWNQLFGELEEGAWLLTTARLDI